MTKPRYAFTSCGSDYAAMEPETREMFHQLINAAGDRFTKEKRMLNLDTIPKVNKQEAGITEGRIVHYQAEIGPGIVACRPAIIVNAWAATSYEHGEVNMTVFPDWSNDNREFTPAHTCNDDGHHVCPPGNFNPDSDPMIWKTSVPMYDPNQSGTPGDRKPGTWHFPERP